MKKIILYFLLALLILAPVDSFARTRLLTSSPVYKGTITGLRISAVDGTAFIDNAGATIPTYADGNHQIEIYDSSNSMLRGVLKAAGSGETLDSDIFSGTGDFSSSTGWSLGFSASIGSGVLTLPSTASYARRTGVCPTGAVVKFSVDVNTLSVGDIVRMYIDNSNYGNVRIETTGAGKTGYVTLSPSSVEKLFTILKPSSAGSAEVDNFLAKQVLTPSALGATIVSAKGGETYNFSYKNASFTYNAASYYCIIRAIR